MRQRWRWLEGGLGLDAMKGSHSTSAASGACVPPTQATAAAFTAALAGGVACHKTCIHLCVLHAQQLCLADIAEPDQHVTNLCKPGGDE